MDNSGYGKPLGLAKETNDIPHGFFKDYPQCKNCLVNTMCLSSSVTIYPAHKTFEIVITKPCKLIRDRIVWPKNLSEDWSVCATYRVIKENIE